MSKKEYELMMRWVKWFGTVTLILVVGAFVAVVWGPVSEVDLSPRFNAAIIGPDIDEWLEEQEEEFPGITPGTEKQVTWAGAKGAKTQIAVVYLHGFSGSSIDLKPVPNNVAEALGAKIPRNSNIHGRNRSLCEGKRLCSNPLWPENSYARNKQPWTTRWIREASSH